LLRLTLNGPDIPVNWTGSPSLFDTGRQIKRLTEGGTLTDNIKSKTLLLQTFFKILHSLHEVALCHRNDQINGVKVFLTIKASCQVCFIVGGGMKVEAQRASEPEYLVLVSHFKVQQVDNDFIYWDLISEHAKIIC
jgi:hypothetical protein